MNMILAILLLSPITTTNYQCKGETCVQIKKKTVKKANRRYQRRKSTRVKRRRTRSQRKTPVLLKKRTGNIAPKRRDAKTTPPRTSTPRPSAKRTAQQTKRARLINLWIRQILLSDPALQHHIKR